jgi:hypothetical protein
MNSPRNNDPQILEPVTMPTNLGRIRLQTRAKICHGFPRRHLPRNEGVDVSI